MSFRNEACLGYVIKALENTDHESVEINSIIDEIRFLFDMKTVEEMEEYYKKSKY